MYKKNEGKVKELNELKKVIEKEIRLFITIYLEKILNRWHFNLTEIW